ncbi:MAG: hypothetical protein U0X76_06290 [Bacteroidia bacterium]
MLEQAEISISALIFQLPELAKENRESMLLNDIKKFLIEVFPADSLPFDLLRLSGIISGILKSLELIYLSYK